MGYVIRLQDFRGRGRKPPLYFCLSEYGYLTSCYEAKGDKLVRTKGPNTGELAKAYRAQGKKDADMIATLVNSLFPHADFVWRARKAR